MRTRGELRKRLSELCPTDSDLNAFCFDNSKLIADKFAAGMNRVDKANLLLESVPLNQLDTALDDYARSHLPPPTASATAAPAEDTLASKPSAAVASSPPPVATSVRSEPAGSSRAAFGMGVTIVFLLAAIIAWALSSREVGCPDKQTRVQGICVEQPIANFASCALAINLGEDKARVESAFRGPQDSGKLERAVDVLRTYRPRTSAENQQLIDSCLRLVSLPAGPSRTDSAGTKSPPDPPVWPGMERIEGGRLRVGHFDMASRPVECMQLSAAEDCTEVTHPERTRELNVAAFQLDTFEVTAEAYATWLTANPQHWKLGADRRHIVGRAAVPVSWLGLGKGCTLVAAGSGIVAARAGDERKPATCVTWYGANAFCSLSGKRLPNDAEWEWAAKGEEERPFPWGADLPQRDTVAFALQDVANEGARVIGSSRGDVTPQGVYDLAGNVAEWVDGGNDVAGKLVRGGSWTSRSACRLLSSGCASAEPDHDGLINVGFRCARSAD